MRPRSSTASLITATSSRPATTAGASRTAPDRPTPPRLTNPRSPRLRNPDHMWTAPWQALFDVTALWRMLSYVRPVDARPQPAGHDDIRVPGFSSAPRARGAGRGSECPGLRFAGSSPPHFALPNVVAVSGETCLTGCRYAAAIGASERKSSPVVMIAQAMRANLLASATVTSRAGRRCKSRLVQAASGSIRLWSQRKACRRSEDEEAS
jgi:hypothetical protein